MKRFICWLFNIVPADHAPLATYETWLAQYPDETTALNQLALHLLPRLTALQAGTLRKMKGELKRYNATTQAWGER